MKVGFVGAGKAGCSMGKYFSLTDGLIEVTGYYSLIEEEAMWAAKFTNSHCYQSVDELINESDSIIVSTPDGVIKSVWDTFDLSKIAGKIFCHLSGSLSSDVFSKCGEYGGFAISIHPMFAFSNKESVYKQLNQVRFTLEGDSYAVDIWQHIFRTIGNDAIVIDKEVKTKYHAAASILSNHVIAVLSVGYDLLTECGFSEEEARSFSEVLVKENVEHVIREGPLQALTGPIERGDGETICKHLSKMSPSQKEIYQVCGKQLLQIAKNKNPNRDYFEIEDMLTVSQTPKMMVEKGEESMKNTVITAKEQKMKGEKISMLTAYDYSTARLIDEAGINMILVGDSLGNVMLGYEDTISVTMEDMIHHGAAVARGVKNALVVVDMPFMSYQTSVYDAVVNAGRLMKEGRAGAVKLEGGESVCPQIKAITAAGIPVCAHLGLTPQSINAFGGFKVQGKTEAAAKQILKDAKAVEEAGAFAVVLECVPAKIAELITKELSIPTIGIGAGNVCDGQVLVYQDMLGMFSDFTPKFVKRFVNVGEHMKNAFAAFDAEVKAGIFPAKEHEYTIDDEVLEKLY